MSETDLWLGHEFTVCDHGGDWNAVPGLYLFAFQQTGSQGTGLWRAVYVGQTNNFATRIPTHENWPAAVQLWATHVHALVVEEESERRRIEEELIRQYQPPLNLQHR